MKKSAEQLYEQAEKYLTAPYGHRNYRRAFRLARRGHSAGNPSFTNMLGYFYEHGFVVQKCPALAFELYREAALQGVPMGLYNVGTILSENFGRHTEALPWWRRGEAVGETNCLVQIGWAYEKGLGVEQNGSKAAEYYRRAAEEGNDLGLANLARCHRIGMGVEKDLSEMIRLLQAARDQDSAMAWYETGFLYDEEELPAENPREKAIECYDKAAELCLLNALEWSGEYFCLGEGQDYARGIRYLNRAIEANCPRAKFVIAVMMADGRATRYGVKRNLKKAFRLCHEAALTGEAGAERMLGMMYDRGEGVKQDLIEAKKWFLSSAEHGNEMAIKRVKNWVE